MKTRPFVLSAVFALLVAGSPTPSFAHGFPASCAGTYLTQEGGGARDFWTLAADGTFFGTTSTQALFHFTNQQGTWAKDGDNGAKGVLLAFVFDDNNELLNIARIDISLRTVGDGCDSVAGSLEGRFFAPNEDPLGPGATSTPPLFSDMVTGRRVK
jgi:hypothetical protein